MYEKRMGQSGYHTAPELERQNVTERIIARLEDEDSILFAFLFGSFFTDPLFHDIDIGIFVRNMPRAAYSAYEAELSEALGNVLGSPFPVEVKIINHAPLPFRFNVIRGRFLFTRNDDFLEDYMTRNALEHIDYAPIRHRYIYEAMA